MVCAALSGRQGRSGAQRDAGHRASAVTHAVGRTAPPFGSRPGARPRRRGPQPYSLIRFSAHSWRIERLDATQAVALVRKAGCPSGEFDQRYFVGEILAGQGMIEIHRHPVLRDVEDFQVGADATHEGRADPGADRQVV